LFEDLLIPGRILPPPPRQIIVERLPIVPPKPQDIIIERWLAYKRRIRSVKFKPATPAPLAPNPKNIIIEWDSPNVSVTKKYINLGMVKTDPQAYLLEHGSNLADASQLPVEASYVKPPEGEILAAHSNPNEPPLLVKSFINLLCYRYDTFPKAKIIFNIFYYIKFFFNRLVTFQL